MTNKTTKPTKDKRVGKQLWKCRSKDGRNLTYKDTQSLWNACVKYFEWVEDNPIVVSKINFYQGKAYYGNLNKMRAMTIKGLCVHLNITHQTWLNYKDRKDFFEVVTKVNSIIYEQKFTGAAANLLNPNIIARDLGLVDKQEVEQAVNTTGFIVQTEPLSIDDWMELGKKSQEWIVKAHDKLFEKKS